MGVIEIERMIIDLIPHVPENGQNNGFEVRPSETAFTRIFFYFGGMRTTACFIVIKLIRHNRCN